MPGWENGQVSDRADEHAGERSDDRAALRWEGDDELGRMNTGPQRRRGRAARAADGGGAGEGGPVGEDADDTAADLGNLSPARRVITVAAAIWYLLIAVGWVLSVQYTSSGSTSVVVDLPWQFGEFMAMVAGPLVFLAVRRITAERSVLAAATGWLVGALLLLPWPILVLLSRGSA